MKKRAGHELARLPEPTELLPLDADFERTLVHLLESRDREGLVVAGRNLLQILAPGVTLSLVSDEDVAQARGEHTLILPLSRRPPRYLVAHLPEGVAQREFQRRIGLVASLLGARDDQLRAMRRLTDNVKRLERAERLQHALYNIAELASSGRDMAAVLQAMHITIGRLMYAKNFFIAIISPDGETIRFPYFVDKHDPDQPPPDHPFPLDSYYQSPTWYVITEGKPLMGSMSDLTEQVPGPLRSQGPDCVHWLGVPLLRGDRATGALVVQSYRENRRYSEADKTLLTYVAQHVQTSLERHQAHTDLERRVAQRTRMLEHANRILRQQVIKRQRGEKLQAALFRIAELASGPSSLDEFYRHVHDAIGNLLNARNFYIALLSQDRTTIDFPYSVDEFDAHRESRRRSAGLTEHVLNTGKPLLSDSDEIQRMKRTGIIRSHGTAAVCWLGVPLMIDNEPIGVLAVQSYSAEQRYDRHDQDLLTFVSWHVGNALERKRNADSLKQANAELEQRVLIRTKALAEANQQLRRQILKSERIEQRLKYQTTHDSLTGLANRYLLLQRLRTALRTFSAEPEAAFAVLYMDLDRFKVINDSVGHLVGDDLLFQAGGRIRACLKGHDVVARLGGDEFAVLLEQIDSVEEACAIAGRIIDELNRPFQLGTRQLYSTASVGIVMASPRYRYPEELLRDADTAMYRAKAAGRQRYAIFDEQMRKQATQLQEIENDLRAALTRNEFEPYFQPIVSLADDRVVGYEALVRWHHPQRGLLMPEDFLGIAEDSGLIERVDQIMLDHILAITPQLACDGRFISINLSARHFRSSERLPELIIQQLRDSRVAPAQVRLEITESALLESSPQVRHALYRLHEAGIGTALDDFGTGYSSLSYLHRFPLSSVKIDRSFVTHLGEDGDNSLPVVQAIMTLANSRGIKVIAEGIETRRQADILRELGCPFGQGFLYSPPRPVETWLVESPG